MDRSDEAAKEGSPAAPQSASQPPEKFGAAESGPDSSADDRSERVAVICVHGVADQSRYATARHFAASLADNVPWVDSDGNHIEHHQRLLQIRNELADFSPSKVTSTQPVNESDSDRNTRARRTYPSQNIQQFVEEEAARISRHSDEEERIRTASRINLFATGKKLERFVPTEADRCYETNVVETQVGARDADFYEIYWGDISRVQNSFIQILTSFYRLIFVLCRISDNVRDFGRINLVGPGWSIVAFTNRMAKYLLAVVIPALNLCILATLASLVPYLFAGATDSQANQAGSSLLLGITVYAFDFAVRLFFLRLSTEPRAPLTRVRWWNQILSAAAVISVATVAGWFLFQAMPDRDRIIFSLGCWYALFTLIAIYLGWKMAKEFGEKFLPPLVFGTFAAMLVYAQIRYGFRADASADCRLLSAVLGIYTAQWMLVGLIVAWGFWFAFSIMSLGATLLISMANHFTGRARQNWRALNAGWTLQVANLGSGFFIIVTVLCLWYAVSVLGIQSITPVVNACHLSELFPDQHSPTLLLPEVENLVGPMPESSFRPVDPCNGLTDAMSAAFARFEPVDQLDLTIQHLNTQSGINFMIALITVVGIFIYATAMLLPAVFAECRRDPWTNRPFAHPFLASSSLRTYSVEDSQDLGSRLSNGYRNIGWNARWILLSALIASAVVSLIDISSEYAAVASPLANALLAILGLGVLGVATQQIPGSAVLASVLDVASDVVNWLRFSPVERNVTSQIYARYDSILKHVSGKDYDRVIILAHSLGSLITVDLLRYWNEVERQQNGLEPRAKLAKMVTVPEVLRSKDVTIDLVTFGSPLNQLLGMRFTTLYGWCRTELSPPERWMDCPDLCDPTELAGIDSWTNIYCSGDYVGRHLWHSNASDGETSINWHPTRDDNRDRRISRENGLPRVEICLGAGAHTRYGEYIPPAVNKFRTAVRDLIGGREDFLGLRRGD